MISVITLNVYLADLASFGVSLRQAAFTTVSIVPTTGFATADFDQWPEAVRILLVGMMFFGGCAGSTGGSMKIVRVYIIVKMMIQEIKGVYASFGGGFSRSWG